MTAGDGGPRPGPGRSPMTPERWARIESLFAEALELPDQERRAFLDRATADPGIRAEVASLLAEHARDPDFLEAAPPWIPTRPGAESLDPTPDGDPDIPERIGEYRILRLLGRGGMGRVFLAERQAEAFRQTVAVKVMRRGLDTDDLLRRFRAERQILATLDHPNIARLLDVGATRDGVPYFVLEYVDGETLLRHCEKRGLTIRERLELFRTVCEAVHHAHQGLVVHRDLKPGNILVTEAGVPKLLDFGIAKILDPERGALAATTEVGERLLTPEYSAPEQVRGEAITTATDVYALGVLLYELLAGRHPFRHEDASTSRAELVDAVLHHEPPPPSTVAPDGVRRRLTGDLDTIVGKALRKDPDARYPSALSLADDLGRHLEGLPVQARPATIRYRARRFVRRNRGAVGAGLAVFLILAGFSAVTAYQSARIREESRQVRSERDKALQVRSFLLETFGATGPDRTAGGDSVTVRELLDRRAATLDDAYHDPALHAELSGVLAEAYEQLGLFDRAEPLARQALQEKLELYGPEHPDAAVAYNVLGWILRQKDELPEAERALRESVRIGRAAFPGGDARLARALNDLGVVLEARGDYDGAAAAYRESLAMRRRFLSPGHVGVAVTTSNLAVVLYRRGKLDSAVTLAAQAVESFRRALGPDHQRTLYALGNLAALRAVQGDHEGAAEVYAQILARHRRVLGDRHPQVAYALSMRANQLVALDRYAEAEPLVREALSIQRDAFGPDDERVGQTLRVLGDVLQGLGRPRDALDRFRQALAIARSRFGDAHKEVGVLRLRMARVLDDLDRDDEADVEYAQAARVLTASLGADHFLTAEATLARAEFLVRSGRNDEARPLVEGAGPVIDGLGEPFRELQDRLAAVRRALAADGA